MTPVFVCELVATPFMALNICHNWHFALFFGTRNSADATSAEPDRLLKQKFIELTALKPMHQPSSGHNQYTIELHLYAQSDPIFGTEKRPFCAVA